MGKSAQGRALLTTYKIWEKSIAIFVPAWDRGVVASFRVGVVQRPRDDAPVGDESMGVVVIVMVMMTVMVMGTW
jgi:hypothetical protein